MCWIGRCHVNSKKISRYFLVIDDHKRYHLRLYEREEFDVEKPKEEIYLAGCVVNVADQMTCVVKSICSTSQKEDFIFRSSSKEETDHLVVSLHRIIRAANGELSKHLVLHLWVGDGKIGGPCWFVVTRKRKLLQFDRILPVEMTIPSNATSVINIQNAKIDIHPKLQKTILIFPSNPTKITQTVITLPDQQSFNGWLEKLREISGGLGEVNNSSSIFGINLEELLEREGGDVPRLVLRCCEFIRQNGIDQKELFKISRNLNEIAKQFSDLIDEEGEINFSEYCDVHDITALLKLFLQKMPEPLFQYNLYPEFLSAQDVKELSLVVAKLRPSHYNLAG
eukprot:TRINITY_DN15310_c0_g2_i1.p1 TRINITY_DN15310_c0_g2~~TRINITY_DN15310_c0_g2_i1.p1  ORF type:complete len:338 (-),score=81.59 TRINITY_DN15310_c0_g2_i1:474-1487(-)